MKNSINVGNSFYELRVLTECANYLWDGKRICSLRNRIALIT